MTLVTSRFTRLGEARILHLVNGDHLVLPTSVRVAVTGDAERRTWDPLCAGVAACEPMPSSAATVLASSPNTS